MKPLLYLLLVLGPLAVQGQTVQSMGLGNIAVN